MWRIGLVFAFLALIGFTVAPASAESRAGFDCAKARSATEKAICKTESLAWLDRQMARLYAEVRVLTNKRGKGVVRDEQRAWLSVRDACGGNRDCIAKEYWKRLVALTFKFKDEGFTGHYMFTDAPDEGSMNAVEFPGDRAVVHISTIVANLGSCDIEMNDIDMRDGDGEDGRGTATYEEPKNPNGTHCEVEIRKDFINPRVSGKADSCKHFCRGVGLFYGQYLRQ